MKSHRLFFALLALLFCVPVFAATFIVPEDKVLIDAADAVITGTVQSSEGVLTNERGIYTFTEILVEGVLKGGDIVPGQLVTVREPGGETATLSLALHGVPRFEAGDRVLLMLKHAGAGMWRTHEYALGRFRFLTDDYGKSYLVRDRENVCGWEPGFLPHRERARRQSEFLDYIRAVSNGESASENYMVDFDQVCSAGVDSELSHVVASVTANAPSDYLSLCGCRWNNGASASFESSGSQGGYADSRSDATAGMSAWNGHGDSNINYSLGGTGGATQAFNSSDGINSLIFEDPSNEVNGSGCFGGAGTIAIGGPWFSNTTHSFGGESHKTIINADLVVDCGVNPSNGISQSAFRAVLAHELGHTLGFRHSNEPSCAGCDEESNALMASLLNNGPGNASLLAWDRRAATAAYGSGVSECIPPAITGQPIGSSIAEGQAVTLTVTATGTSLSYQWFEGNQGDTTKPVGTNSPSFTTPVLTATKNYWVRVTNSCGGAFSSTATVTVIPNCPSGKLCSLNGRFELGLTVRDHRTNKTGTGFPLQQSDLFGFFSLPDLTGDPNNPEVFVKMLDGRNITGDFWVFYGGLTDVEYTLTVTDTQTNSARTYFKSGGSSNGGFDVGLGVAPETCVGEVDGTVLSNENPSVCSAGSNRLCLNTSRFRVELSARDQRTGNTAAGLSIPQQDIFGYFSIPGLTGDPNNPEVFVKVVDGRVVNNHFWVFFSGLTDFEYTLTVVDTFTGMKRAYTKDAGSACGFFDTNTF